MYSSAIMLAAIWAALVMDDERGAARLTTLLLCRSVAQKVFDKYFSHNSPYEVNVDQEIRERLEQSMSSPNIHSFDAAQDYARYLLETDCMPKFNRSEYYRNYVEERKKHPRIETDGAELWAACCVGAQRHGVVCAGYVGVRLVDPWAVFRSVRNTSDHECARRPLVFEIRARANMCIACASVYLYGTRY